MIRIRPEGQVLAVEDGGDPAAYGVLVELGQPQPGRRAREPLEVPGEGERQAVDDLDRLEDPVAHGEAVVGDPDRRGGRVGQQFTVDPGAHGLTLGVRNARVNGARTRPRGPGFCTPGGIGYCSHAPRPGSPGSGAQADVAQLVERNLAKVEVASSSLVVRSERSLSRFGLHGGVAERRGNGLQIRLHGFKSRLHLEHHRSHMWDRCCSRAIGAVVARFLDTEEVTGSNPVSPTSTTKPLSRSGRGAFFLPSNARTEAAHRGDPPCDGRRGPPRGPLSETSGPAATPVGGMGATAGLSRGFHGSPGLLTGETCQRSGGPTVNFESR